MDYRSLTSQRLVHSCAKRLRPGVLTRKLHELYQRVGGFGGLLMLCYDWEGENRPRWRRSMALLAKDVIPRLEALT